MTEQQGIGPRDPNWTAAFQSRPPDPYAPTPAAENFRALGIAALATSVLLVGVVIGLVVLVMAPRAWSESRRQGPGSRSAVTTGLVCGLFSFWPVAFVWVLVSSDWTPG